MSDAGAFSPWFGQVNSTWPVKALKRVVRLVNYKTEAVERSYVGLENISSWTGKAIESTEQTSPEGLSSLFEPGDVLFGKLRPYLAKVLHALAAGRCTSELLVLRPRELDPRYLQYLLLAEPLIRLVDASTFGAKMPRADWEFIGQLRVPVPASTVQRGIADFLDRKTAAIDALLAKKDRVIELLQEKRQALVTQAVTRGLDTKVPMKDSGIVQLGRIPAHWQIKRLKHLSPQVTVGIVVTPSKYYVDDGVPCPRSFNIKPGLIDRRDLAFISEGANQLHAKSIIRLGDLVAVRTGQPGTTAVVESYFDGANCIDLIIVRRAPTQFDSQYLCHFMNSSFAHHQYGEGSEGALQQHFNVETAKNLLVPLPPMVEQRRIASALDESLKRADRLASAVRTQIERLREYRQVLITAAVTGKVDVTKAAA